MRILVGIGLAMLLPVAACAEDAPKRGGKTVEQWVEQLEAKDPATRLQALQFLGDFGPDAQPAVGPLTKLLKDGDPKTRAQVAAALGRLGPAAKEAVSALMLAVKEADAELSLQAIAALGRMGPAAREAVPMLVALAQKRDAARAYGALAALGRIGVADKEVVALLTEALADADAVYRRLAVQALVDLDLGNEDVRAALVRAMRDKDPAIRTLPLAAAARWQAAKAGPEAIQALLDLLLKHDDVVPLDRLQAAKILATQLPKDNLQKLRPALKDRNPLVRLEVATALARDSKTDELLPIFLSGLDDEDPEVRAFAARHLPRAFGEKAPPAIMAALTKLLKPAGPPVRREAAVALLRLTQETKEGLPVLLALLEDKTPDVRGEAARSLGSLGPQVAGVHAAVIKRLQKDINPFVRAAAADALGRMAMGTEALQAALKDKSSRVRLHAAAALLRMKEDDKQAATAVLDALQGRDGDLCRDALLLLQELDAKTAAEFLPALTALLQDAEPSVRQAAWLALQRLEKK